MKIIKNFSDDTAVSLSLSGHFTLENVQYFTETINPLLNQKKQFFFINFKDITMLDSSAIGALLKCANSMKNLGIELTLYDVSPHIKTIMHSAYLHKIFTIAEKADLQKIHPRVKL